MWYEMPEKFPEDGEIVWVRLHYFANPFLATYDSDTDLFTTVDSHVVPWYLVRRWRHQ